jgi:hypothetical protein
MAVRPLANEPGGLLVSLSGFGIAVPDGLVRLALCGFRDAAGR